MKRNVLGSILGLATVLLLVGGIGFGVAKAKGTNDAYTPFDDGEEIVEEVVAEEESEVVDVESEEHHDHCCEAEGEAVIYVAENYDEVIQDAEEMEGRLEVAKEVAKEMPHEYINPNAIAGRERALGPEDFDNLMDYEQYRMANCDRPRDIDGYYMDVEGYEPIIDPSNEMFVVGDVVFDHNGDVMTKEELEEKFDEVIEKTE